jgi:hypothetical protein
VGRKVTETFICEHCNKSYPSEDAYTRCVLSHDIVYIGLERQEWKELVLATMALVNQGYPLNNKIVDKILKFKLGVSR